MSDREKVINDLQMQIEELEERLAIVLEGQPEIVRCKDCAKRPCIYIVANENTDNWFCAGGKRKEERK